ncbi:MAG: BamA/TamA family outer membrane protein [Gemmatimonadota bacterium]
MRNLFCRFGLYVLLALATPLATAPLLGQEPEVASPVPPPDDPRRPQVPPGVDTGRNPLWTVLGAPLRLLDRIFYNWAAEREEECGSMAAGIGSATCEPSHVSYHFGSLGSKSGFWGLGFGLHSNLADPTGFKTGFTAAATWRAYQEHTAYIGWNDPSRRPFIRLTGLYDLDTKDRFFGLGPDSDPDDEVDYDWEHFGAELRGGVPPRFGVWGSGGVRYEKSFTSGGWSDDQPDITDPVDGFPDLPGVLDPQQELWGPFGEIVLDLTDSPGHPVAGVRVKARGARYSSVNDLDFNWITYGGEVQGHLPLGSQWHILSAMVGFDQAEPEDDGDEIPFVYLPYLGGSTRLRGYDTWRFTDRTAAYGTVEYRYRIWHENFPDDDEASAIETAIFYDFGEVGEDLDAVLDEFEFGDKYSYGLEFRAYVREAFVFRAGIARSDEATRLNFKFSDIY